METAWTHLPGGGSMSSSLLTVILRNRDIDTTPRYLEKTESMSETSAIRKLRRIFILPKRYLPLGRGLLDLGIAVCLLSLVIIYFTGGFKTCVLGVPVGATHLGNPGRVLLILLLGRWLVCGEARAPVWMILSVVCTLLVIEVGVRVAAHVREPGEEAAARVLYSKSSREPPREWQEAQLGDLVQGSEVPDVIYELMPNVRATFLGKRLTTNAAGFRGEMIRVERQSGDVRIVGLGDSIMFGWGSNNGEAYLEVLGQELRSVYPGCNWEIINAAVPGYNTYMEVAALRHKWIVYEPDLVVIDFVGNDLDLPRFIMKRISLFTVRRFFLKDLVQDRLRSVAWSPLERLEDAPRNWFFRHRYEFVPDLVPERFRHMVGVDAFGEAMGMLRGLSVEHGFEVLVFCTGSIQEPMLTICRDLGFPILEAKVWELGRKDRAYRGDDPALMAAHGVMDDFLEASGEKSYLSSTLTVGAEDPHPSALCHGALGRMLFAYLQSSGMAEGFCSGGLPVVMPDGQTYQHRVKQ